MSMIVSNNNWDATGRIPVPVIASFSDKGEVKPIYVRIGHQDLKVISSRNTTPAAFKQCPRFEVQVNDNGIARFLHLVYHMSDCIWTAAKEEIGIINEEY